MAETNAEKRFLRLQPLLDHRHGINTGRGRIAGAVRQEQSIGIVRHDLLECRGGGQHGHTCAGCDEVTPDVALSAEIDRDAVRGLRLLLVSRLARLLRPKAAAPYVTLSRSEESR